MYVKFQGTISGIGGADTMVGIQFACKTGTDYTKHRAFITDAGYTDGGAITVTTVVADILPIKTAFDSAGGMLVDVGALVSGTTYTSCVRIAEYRGSGSPVWGVWTDYGTPLTFTSPPPIGAPTNLNNTDGNNQVALLWTAPSGTFTGYRIYRADSGSTGYPGSFTLVGTVATGTTTYTDTTAVNNSQYWYYVAAYTAGGDGNKSNYVFAWPNATVHFEQNFNALAAASGQALTYAGMTVQNAGTCTILADPENSNNKIYKHGTGSGWWVFTNKSNDTRIKVRCQSPQAANGGNIIRVEQDNSQGVVILAFDSDNHIKRWNGSAMVNLSTDTTYLPNIWYNVELVINWAGDSYTIYINSTLVQTSITTLDPSAAYISRLYQGAWPTNYDYIRVI